MFASANSQEALQTNKSKQPIKAARINSSVDPDHNSNPSKGFHLFPENEN
jgi:hypothetical protein